MARLGFHSGSKGAQFVKRGLMESSLSQEAADVSGVALDRPVGGERWFASITQPQREGGRGRQPSSSGLSYLLSP